MKNTPQTKHFLNPLLVRLSRLRRNSLVNKLLGGILLATLPVVILHADIPDRPTPLPESEQTSLAEKIYWQNRALDLLHGHENFENQITEEENLESLAEQLENALLKSKIEEWFF